MSGAAGSWPVRIVILLVAGAAATAVAFALGVFSAAPVAAELRTAPVTRGGITQTVVVSGAVSPASQVRLSFKQGGRLAEVYVKPGEQVLSGQPLAKLDETDLFISVSQAQANVASAQARYDAAAFGVSPEDVAVARQSVENAQRSLAETQRSTETDVAVARQSFTRVRTNYLAARGNFSTLAGAAQSDVVAYQRGVENARAQLTQAQNDLAAASQTRDVQNARASLDQAQSALTNAAAFAGGSLQSALTEHISSYASLLAAASAFDEAVTAGSDASAASAAYQAAQAAYTTAATRLQNALDAPTAQIASAQASVTTAQNALNSSASKDDTSLDKARASLVALQQTLTAEQQLSATIKGRLSQAATALTTMTDAIAGTYVSSQQAVAAAQERASASLTSANNALASAQASLAKTAASPKSFDIAAAYASVLVQQAALDGAQNALNNATLRSPANGVVAAVAAQPGEFVAGGSTTNPFMVIANTASVAIHGTVGEADVAKLRIGQVATVTVDAVGAAVRMTGKVTALDPAATIQQGVPVYGVDVTIDVPDAGIRAGMTGTASVIVASKQGVLLVPNLAIRSTAGRRGVQVLRDGAPVDAEVTFGISNETSTEVTGGLSEGDLVVLPQPRTGTPQQQPGAGGGGIRVPPGR